MAPRRFIYAGSPGRGFNKDYLAPLLEAFYDLSRRGLEFRFVVVGLRSDALLDAKPGLRETLGRLGDRGVWFFDKGMMLENHGHWNILLTIVAYAAVYGFHRLWLAA